MITLLLLLSHFTVRHFRSKYDGAHDGSVIAYCIHKYWFTTKSVEILLGVSTMLSFWLELLQPHGGSLSHLVGVFVLFIILAGCICGIIKAGELLLTRFGRYRLMELPYWWEDYKDSFMFHFLENPVDIVISKFLNVVSVVLGALLIVSTLQVLPLFNYIKR